MTTVTQPTSIVERILRVQELADYIVPLALRMACELRVADELQAGPRSVTELAAATRADLDVMQRLLRALAAKNVFAETAPETWTLTPLAELLLGDHPLSLRDTLPFLAPDVQAWARLDHTLRTGVAAFEHVHGQRFYDYVATHPAYAERIEASLRAQNHLVLRSLLPAYDWRSCGTIVDVGGGTGTFLAGVLARFRELRAVLFDRPCVIEQAHALLAEAGVTERTEVVGGDFFDEIPGGGDTYLLKTILHDWSDEKALQILTRIRAACPARGRLLVIEALLPGGDVFHLGKLIDLHSMVLGAGPDRDHARLATLLRSGGFEPVRTVWTPTLAIVECRPSTGSVGDDSPAEPGAPLVLPVGRVTALIARLQEVGDLAIPFATRVVCDLGVADELRDGPVLAEHLADRLEVRADELYRTLRALASRGFFTEVEPRTFALTPLADLLRSDHALSLRGAYPLLPANFDAWARFDHTVSSGEPAFELAHGVPYYDHLARAPRDAERFTAIQRAGNRLEVRLLLRAFDWRRVERVVDVGGADGAFLAALLARNRHLRGVLLDLPHAVTDAVETFVRAGVDDRVDVVAASFFEYVPQGADAYVLKRVLYEWDDERAWAVLTRVREAMHPEGRVLVIDPVAVPGNDFDPGKIYDLLSLVMVGGRVRSEEELRELMGCAGLDVVSTVSTTMLPVLEAVAAPTGRLQPPEPRRTGGRR